MAFKKGDKRKVRRFSVQPAQNKGVIVNVEHHPKSRPSGKGASAMMASNYVPDEQYVHSDANDAKAHVSNLIERMCPPPSGDGTSAS